MWLYTSYNLEYGADLWKIAGVLPDFSIKRITFLLFDGTKAEIDFTTHEECREVYMDILTNLGNANRAISTVYPYSIINLANLQKRC